MTPAQTTTLAGAHDQAEARPEFFECPGELPSSRTGGRPMRSAAIDYAAVQVGRKRA